MKIAIWALVIVLALPLVIGLVGYVLILAGVITRPAALEAGAAAP